VVVVRVSWFRKSPPPPKQDRHPDGGVEAQLQRVRDLQCGVARTEARIEDIRKQQNRLDTRRQRRAESAYPIEFDEMKEHAAELRAERTALEASMTQTQADVAALLTALGPDAVYL
jgi:predicted  nucleic acid-binding Zn-ribbon protein